MRLYRWLLDSAISDRWNNANNLDNVDKALQRYILNPEYIFEVENIGNEALKRYPNKRPTTLYRGLNFATKEEYIDFLNKIKNGRITLNKFSSWTENKKLAESFAKTRKVYLEFISPNDPIIQMIKNKNKTGEKITGYRGIVISTKINANQAIDLKNFKFKAEDEMILPNGTYKIEYKEILSYNDEFKNKNPNDIILSIKSEEEFKDISKWFFKQYDPKTLTDEAKHKIYLLLKKNKKITYTLKKEYFNGSKTIYIYIGPLFKPEDLNWFNNKDKEEIKKDLKQIIPKFLKDLEREYLSEYKNATTIEWNDNIQFWIKYSGYEKELINMLKNTLGKEYNNLTNYDNIKKINSMKNKEDVINKHAQDLMRIFKSL